MIVVGTGGEDKVSVGEVVAFVGVFYHFGCVFAAGGFKSRDQLGFLDGFGLEDALLQDCGLLLGKGRL